MFLLCLGLLTNSTIQATDVRVINESKATLTTITTAAAGNWNTAGTWSPSGVPGSGDVVTVNHALVANVSINIGNGGSYVINQTVTDAAGGSAYGINMSGSGALEIKANTTFEGGLNQSNNTSLIVRSGYTLIVGAISISNNASIVVEAGATLIVNGSINASNNVPIQVDGVIQVNGSYGASNNVGITGSGDFFTTGTLTMSNSAATFGSQNNCNSGPCSGRNLCSFTNTLSSTSSSICPLVVPTINGVSNAVSPTFLWEVSTTSSSSGFTTATGTSNGANYTPPVGPSVTSYYRKTISTAACTSKAVQTITVNGASIGTPPAPDGVCTAGTATFSVVPAGPGPFTYSWQVFNGLLWSNISLLPAGYSNYTTSTLTFSAATALNNGYQYRVVVTNACNSVTSPAASLNVSSVTGNWVGGNGNWSTPANWCGGVPTITSDVVISNGTVTVDVAGGLARNVTITNPGALALGSGNSLSVYGNWTGNNNLTQTGGTINFIGTASQTINGNNSFEDVVINKTVNPITIASGASNTQTIKGGLTLTSGTLATNGNLTIDFGNGGAIAGTGSGVISGNLTTTRTSSAGWHYIGAPIDGLTYANINSSVPITTSNFYTYQESVNSTNVSSGWTKRTEASTTSLRAQKDVNDASDMIGYALYYPSSKAMNLTGTYTHNKNYTTGSMSFVSSGTASSDGWHLIANPYPSYVDWNSSTGWTKTNIVSSITYYDPATATNMYYIPAIGPSSEQFINGASPYIPPMQAFWVQSTAANASVAINNNSRVLNPDVTTTYHSNSFYRLGNSDEKALKLEVSGTGGKDETVLRFGGNATADFDGALDACKFMNDAPASSLYTNTNTSDYAINSLPALVNGKEYPLHFQPGTNGNFSLTTKSVKNFNGLVLLLEDTHLEVLHNLSQTPYSFKSEVGDEPSRFVLKFVQMEDLESITAAYGSTVTGVDINESESGDPSINIQTYDHDVRIQFKNHTSNSANIFVYNLQGHEIFRQADADISSGNILFQVDPNYKGIYIVKAVTGEITHAKKIELMQQ